MPCPKAAALGRHLSPQTYCSCHPPYYLPLQRRVWHRHLCDCPRLAGGCGESPPATPHVPTFSSIFCQNCRHSMMTMMATRMKMIATRHPIRMRVLLSSTLSVGSGRRGQQEQVVLGRGDSPCSLFSPFGVPQASSHEKVTPSPARLRVTCFSLSYHTWWGPWASPGGAPSCCTWLHLAREKKSLLGRGHGHPKPRFPTECPTQEGS